MEEISLGNLLAMFQEEDVTIDMILEMDHEDMKEIGVKTNEPVLVDETPDNFYITDIYPMKGCTVQQK